MPTSLEPAKEATAPRRRWATARWAPLLAMMLVLTGCGTASATSAPQETAQAPAEQTPATNSDVPESLNTPARPVEFEPISIEEILRAAVTAVDAELWAAGYYGPCPTAESLGIDPLSIEAVSGPAELTGQKVCSWQSVNTDGIVLASLDRLDVLGDEAQYWVALGQDDNEDWRLATETERESLDAPGLTTDATFLNDHLVPSGTGSQIGA